MLSDNILLRVKHCFNKATVLFFEDIGGWSARKNV